MYRLCISIICIVWVLSQVFFSLRLTYVEAYCFSYDFNINNVLRYFVWKVLIVSYYSYMYAMNDIIGLVQDLREVNMLSHAREFHIFQGVLSGCDKTIIILTLLETTSVFDLFAWSALMARKDFFFVSIFMIFVIYIQRTSHLL